ncbi:MAG: hypothetical protein FJX21_04900 [Alphaproteobacteria bacterium]|nr:hypothetical protein [Alphaproteobacteria bacterium]
MRATAVLSAAALAAGMASAQQAGAPDARVDYPKLMIRLPAGGAMPPALSIAATAYIPADNLERAQRREGEIRVRIFEAVAKAYQGLPPGGAAGLDIKLLEERISAEVAELSGGGPVRVVFREFALR